MTSTFTRTPRTTIVERHNFHPNPGFETITGGIPNGCTASGAGTVASSTAWAVQGTRSLQISGNGASNDSAAYIDGGATATIMRTGLEPGKSYTALCWMRLSAPLTGALHASSRRIQLLYSTDGVNAFQNLVESDPCPNVAGQYLVRLKFAIPANATGAFLRVHAGVASGGGSLWVDGFTVTEGDYDGAVFDGNTPDSASRFYDWDGASNASTTTVRVINPADITTPIQVNGYEAASDARTVTRQAANSSLISVTVIPAGPRSGSLELLYDDVTDAQAAEALFRTGSMFTFADTDVPEIAMLFAPSGGPIRVAQDDTRQAWLVTVPFVEVPA